MSEPDPTPAVPLPEPEPPPAMMIDNDIVGWFEKGADMSGLETRIIEPGK